MIDLARLLGWFVFHARVGYDHRGRPRTQVNPDGVGFPDLVMVHPGQRRAPRDLLAEHRRWEAVWATWAAAR